MDKDDYVRLISIIPSVIDEKLERIRVKIQIAVRKLLAKELLDLRREFGELLQSFQNGQIVDTGPVIISVAGSSGISEVRKSSVVPKTKHDRETAVACRSIVDERSYRLRFEIPMIVIGLANRNRIQEHYGHADVVLNQASLLLAPKEEQRELSKELFSETNSTTLTQETTDKQTTLQKYHEQLNTIQPEIKTHDDTRKGNTSMPKSTIELLDRDTAAHVPRETAKKMAKRSYETDDEIWHYWNYRESPPQQTADAPKTLYARRQLEKIKEIRRSEELKKTHSSKRLKSTVDIIIPTSHESPKKTSKRLHNDNYQSAGNAKQRKVQQYLDFPIEKKLNNSKRCKEVPLKVEEAFDLEPNFIVRRTSLDLQLVKISSLGGDKKREKSSEEDILYRNIVNNSRKDENQASMNTEASLRNLEVTAVNINTKKITTDTKKELKHYKDVPGKNQEAIDLEPTFNVQTSLGSDEGAVSYKNIVNNTSKDEHWKPMDGDTSSQNLEATTEKFDNKIIDSKNTTVIKSKPKNDQEKIDIDLELQKATSYPTKTKSPNISIELNASKSLQNVEKALHKSSVEKNTVEQQTVVNTSSQNLEATTVILNEKINDSKNTAMQNSKHQKDQEKIAITLELHKATPYPTKTKSPNISTELSTSNDSTEESLQNIEKVIHKSSIEKNTVEEEAVVDTSSQNLKATSVKLDEKINDSKNTTMENSKHKKNQEKIGIDLKLQKATPYPTKTKFPNTLTELSTSNDSTEESLYYTEESLHNIEKGLHESSVEKNTVEKQKVVDTAMQNLKVITVGIDKKINYSKNTNVKSAKHNHKDRKKDTGDRELQKGTSDPVKIKIADIEAELIYRNGNTEESFQNAVEKNTIEDQTPVVTAVRNLEVITLKMDEKIDDSKNITIDTKKVFKHSKKILVKPKESMNLEDKFSLQPSVDVDKVPISYGNIIINTSKDEQRTPMGTEASMQNLQPAVKPDEKINDSKNIKVKNSKHDNNDRAKINIDQVLPKIASGQEKIKISDVKKKLNTKKNVADNNIIEDQATVKRAMQNLGATVKIDKKVINEKKDKNRKSSTKNSSNEKSKETTSGAGIRHKKTPSIGLISEKAKKPARSTMLPNKNDNTRDENHRDDVMTLEDAVQNLETKTNDNKNAKRDYRKESKHQKKTVEKDTVHQSKAPDTDKTEIIETGAKSATNLTMEESGQNTRKERKKKEMQENELPNDLTAVYGIMQNLRATSIKIDKDSENSKTVDLGLRLPRRQCTRWANASPPTKVLEAAGSAAAQVKMQCKDNDFSLNITDQETSSNPDLCEVSSTELKLISIYTATEKSVTNSADLDGKIHNTRNIHKDARKGLQNQLKQTGKVNPYPDLCEVSSAGIDFSACATHEHYLVRDIQKDSRCQNKKPERENPEPQHAPSAPEISDKNADLTVVDMMTDDTVKIPHEEAIRKITIEEQLELLMPVDTTMQYSDATAIEIDKKTKNRNTNKDSKKKSKYDSKRTGNTTDLDLAETTPIAEKAIISFEGSELNNANMVAMEESVQNDVKDLHEPGGLVGSVLRDFGANDEIKKDNRKFDKKKCEKTINVEIQNECKAPDKAVEGGIELKIARKDMKLLDKRTTSQKKNKKSTKNEKPETTPPKLINPLRCFRKTLLDIDKIKMPPTSEAKKVHEPIKSDEIIQDSTKNTLKNKKSESSQLKEINNSNIDLTTPIKRIETPAPTQNSPHFVIRRKRCIIRNK